MGCGKKASKESTLCQPPLQQMRLSNGAVDRYKRVIQRFFLYDQTASSMEQLYIDHMHVFGCMPNQAKEQLKALLRLMKYHNTLKDKKW